ncbi:hypothetical protein L3Q82_006425 [Scortum barcoo]|uniref:Uncharacterized protein n=1 Tax=Scortum barcoo TaxID=214431 RepID=A0ACB8WZ58_9TELE|nr:hypothetical protein L3Q82_006425 [Scortum barcoo]
MWRLFLRAVLQDLEHLMIRCRPYYLPREFTSVVMTAVYVLPHADTNKAMDELYGVIDRTEISWPDPYADTYKALPRPKLKARTDAYNSGDLEEYRKSRYALRRAISRAKGQYRDKYQGSHSNTRSMWAGLKTLTDYKKKISSAEVMSASLPDELNTFYARFESTSPAVEVQKAQEDHCPPVISRADVCRTLKRINTRKAPGPDGIPGRALKSNLSSPPPSRTHWTHFSLPTGPTGQLKMPSPSPSTLPSSHLDQRDTYVRMLFIDLTTAQRTFNTIVPSKLVTEAQRPRAQHCPL